ALTLSSPGGIAGPRRSEHASRKSRTEKFGRFQTEIGRKSRSETVTSDDHPACAANHFGDAFGGNGVDDRAIEIDQIHAFVNVPKSLLDRGFRLPRIGNWQKFGVNDPFRDP